MAAQGFGGPPQYSRIAPTDYYTAALAGQASSPRSSCASARARASASDVPAPGRDRASGGHFRGLSGPGNGLSRDTDVPHVPGGGRRVVLPRCGNQSFWAKLCKALGREDLATIRASAPGSRAGTMPTRSRRCSRPRSSRSRATSGSRSSADYDIPAAGTQTLRDFMDDPAVAPPQDGRHVRSSGGRAPHLDGPAAALLGVARADAGPPPTLGQHTAEILREAGYDDATSPTSDGARGCGRPPSPPPHRRRGRSQHRAELEGAPMSYETILVDRKDHVVTSPSTAPTCSTRRTTHAPGAVRRFAELGRTRTRGRSS